MSPWFDRTRQRSRARWPGSQGPNFRVGAVRPWTLIGASLAALTMFLTSCSSASQSASSAGPSAVLTIGDSETPVSMNPALDYATFYQWRSLSNLSITHIETSGAIGPGLATKFGFVNSAGASPYTVFEFTLRKGLKFSDGSPLNAQAVVTWLNYFAKQPGLYQSQMGPIASITATGPLSVRMQLKSGNALVPYLLSEAGNWGAVESPNAVAHPSLMSTQSFGVGPYKLDPAETVANSTYTFVPNTRYYDKSAIRWKKVVIKIITSTSSMLDAIQTGQIDVAAGDVTTAASAASAGLKVLSVPYGDGGLLFYNRTPGSSNPIGNVLVRQALNYAVDRPAICKALYGKYGSPATSAMPATDASLPPGDTYPYNYDVSKAKSLLRQAGYANGGFSVNMLAYYAEGIAGTVLPQAIAKYFQAIGVGMQITTPTSASGYVEDNATKRFPVEQNTVGLRPLEQDYEFLFPPSGALNPFKSDDPTLDSLYGKALASTSSANYKKYLDEMVLRITQQADSLNVCTVPRLWYVSKNVAGVNINESTTAPLATEIVPTGH